MTELNRTRHTPDFATSPQLLPADLHAAAARAGLNCTYMPVVPSAITGETVAEFGRILASLPTPVLAFCYTGGRAAKLYRLATGR